MNQSFLGTLIRRERLRKNWSQEGLCRGICANSYLSKVEQGKVTASREVVRALLQRLETSWYDDETTCRRATELAERLYEAFFSLDKAALKRAGQEMDDDWETLSHSPRLLDFLLFRAIRTKTDIPVLCEFAPSFNERQQTLWMLLQQRYEDLLKRYPSAYTYLAAGAAAYQAGSYPMALERLQHGYDLAAAQGYVYIMLESRVLMGNCYSDTMEFDRMQEHFRVAERLAVSLKDQTTQDIICYNTQSTNLEMGKIEESYAYFSHLKHPTAMALHKLAICCEKLGKTADAMAAIDRAERETNDDFPLKDLTKTMCELVRYRLEHPGYLKESKYGEILLSCFERVRKKLPKGYANFHLSWVLEWYAATRQYKQAFEILLHFPYYKD